MQHFRTLLVWSLLAIAAAGGWAAVQGAANAPAAVATKEDKHRKLADDFFRGPIVSFEITLTPDQVERLKHDERNYVEASVKEGANVYKTALKLKGAAGSFQGFDGRPGMTLNFEKFKGGERFRGMKKLHLNNAVQDATLLNEEIAGEIARAAGVPASRCTHALVKLNGRDLGMYVVKEAYTKDFIAAFYQDPSGDLWDGGFCKDLEENMEKDEGDPKDKAALKELIAACQEGDAAKRWEQVGKLLDVERFISFAALESLLCHWDGYNFNRNNYRLYRDPQTGKFSFFLHGMDQMFGDANFPLVRDFPSLVGGAVLRSPQGAALYRTRLEAIQNTVLKAQDWPARVVAEGQRVQAAMAAKDAQMAKDYEGRIGEAKQRVAERIAAVDRLLGSMPKPVVFDPAGVLMVGDGWRPEPGEARLEEVKAEGKTFLHITAPQPSAGSWRRTLPLASGKYRFDGVARTAGAQAVDTEKGRGAGLRISGGGKRANSLEGDAAWKVLTYEFETPGGEVTLVAELQASKGDAWFHTGSFRLVRLP